MDNYCHYVDASIRRFKALQYLVVIYFSLGQYDKMVDRYHSMLQYLAAVTRNECTEAINLILDTIASSTNVQVLSQMYEITLVALKTANNERLWFSTNLKLAKLYLEALKTAEVERLLADLKKVCRLPSGADDPDKGGYLLEIYSIEIQLCAHTHDTDRMKSIYPKTLNLHAAVSDPRIMGIIREEGGKMQMTEGNWMDAYNEFYEAFRYAYMYIHVVFGYVWTGNFLDTLFAFNVHYMACALSSEDCMLCIFTHAFVLLSGCRHYQEAGNSRARDCLKYVVMASMLSLSDINPFAAREAKAFADDPEIIAMIELRQSLEANDLHKFEKTVKNKRNRILDEPLLQQYLEPLRRRMREHVVANLVRPYERVRLGFIADELSLSAEQVEDLLVDLIRESKLSALIDKPNGWLIVLQKVEKSEQRKVEELLELSAENLLYMQESVLASILVCNNT
ncbi:hypothetical protein EON65_37785 [archaeon]|nr:MAG: hypothetical protein EON65_37785 [archaeon]